MSRIDDYRAALRELDDWEPFLLAESRLPGPRGNLELAHAVALEGTPERFASLRANGPDVAPENTPRAFLAFCGVLGLGGQAADGDVAALAELRAWASDPRWRVREAVATALQTLGDADPGRLVAEMREWARGTRLEQRAAVAALCEPRLLDEPTARATLAILDDVTASLAEPRGDDAALRKALSYGWSVAVCALPDPGRAAIERWIAEGDAVVRRIMRDNLRKARLARLDRGWVDHQLARLAARGRA